MSPELGVAWFSGWVNSNSTIGWMNIPAFTASDSVEGFGPRELGMRWEPGPNERVPRILLHQNLLY